MQAVIEILYMLMQAILVLVIVQFLIGLAFSFNVINTTNQFMWQVYNSIQALLAPILAPIRRIMPQTGAIDFSPMVLILLLNAIMIVLENVPTQ